MHGIQDPSRGEACLAPFAHVNGSMPTRVEVSD